MQRITRKVAIYSTIIVALILSDTTAVPGHNLPFDHAHQNYTDNQRTLRINRNEEDQKKSDNDLRNKTINNVHIHIFLIAPNKAPTNSKMQISDLHNQEIGNNIPILGSQQNPISLKIDLGKGTVNEVSNSLSRINDEGAIFVNDGLDEAALTQNFLKTFNSLLRDDFSHIGNDNSKNYAIDLQNTTVRNAKESLITATGKPIPIGLTDLEKGSTMISTLLTDRSNGNNEDEVQYNKPEKRLLEKAEPSTRYKPNADIFELEDKIWSNTNFDETNAALPNIMEEKTPRRSSNLNLNPIGRRFGKLASSHILDYSEFLTRSPSVETGAIVPDFGAILNSSEQIPSTATISIGGKETQSSGATINFGSYASDKGIFSTTSRVAISKNILPDESLVTSTVSLPKDMAELVIFPNKQNFDTTLVGMKLSPTSDDTSRPSEQKVMMVNFGTASTENTTIPKINSENRDFGSANPAAFITVGDREILEEQKPQMKVSSFFSVPRIVVGEKISDLQETHPSESVEDEAAIIERQATIPSMQKQNIKIIKNTSPYQVPETESTEVPQQTQFKEPFQPRFSSRNGVKLTDLVAQGTKIAHPDIFFIPEQDFATSESDYEELIDSLRTSLSNTDTLFIESERDERESEVLKSESITSSSIPIPESTKYTQFTQPHLSLNPITLEAMNDKPSVVTLNEISMIAEDTNELKTIKPIYCDISAVDGDECPIANDKSDQAQCDVLFLIDASRNISKIHFQRAVKIVMDTVEQFRNIGPDGIQISLVQFTREPVLEFSFRKHNCKPCLLADIGNTEYIGGLNNADNAIHKVVKYGFSKRRGDRNEVANVLIIINSGISDDRFQETLQLLNPNSTTVIVLSTEDTNSQLIKQLIKDERHQNFFFNVTAVEKDQLANHLAERVRTIAEEKSTYFEKPITMITDESVRKFTVHCLNNGFNVTFTLLKSFGGTIAVQGKNATKSCSRIIQAEQFGENIETREVNLFISFEQCDVKETASVNPAGMNYSTLINVIHDKWLVTGADKGFVAHCYQAQQSQEQNLVTDLDLQGEIKIAEILPLNSVPPLCNYSIRADAPNGPLVQSAKLGETVYHRWECENGEALDLYGLHIHDCYAESEIEQQHIIIDSKGCSADTNIVSDVVYADDKLLAFSHVKVFKLINSEHLSFHCKLSLCIRKADGCEGITPPRCPRTGHKDLLAYRQIHHNTESFLAALTVEEEAEFSLILSVNIHY
ncbi:von Willebrand factor type A domain protein [Onchocerca flexuosa]|uniref:von Willebrand factor type A domain protein n=1 Tax=Onchocerca flexuosa TaxID=387005 RepID=A0A238BW06_9BILA|nr:von Willebrand factor type A domain protein [Onchocerca flexuosa]